MGEEIMSLLDTLDESTMASFSSPLFAPHIFLPHAIILAKSAGSITQQGLIIGVYPFFPVRVAAAWNI